MAKRQQMRWNRWSVQPFLNIRVAVLDGTLERLFRQIYPHFQAANDVHGLCRSLSPNHFVCSRLLLAFVDNPA